MAYTKTTWSSGLVLTSTRLNNLETQYDNALADLRAAANAWTAANSFTGSHGQITVGDTSNANKAGGIWFGRGTTPGATGFVGYSSATTNTDFVIKSGGAAGILAFWAGDSERARIMEDGDFLINRTTDDSSGAKLQVNGDISESGTKLSNKYRSKTACVLGNTTATNVAAGGTSSATLTWDTEIVDTDGLHSTSSNTSRITIGTSGVYRVFGRFEMAKNGGFASEDAAIQLLKNGSGLIYLRSANSAFGTTSVTDEFVLSLSAGDYLEFKAYNFDAADALTVRPYDATYKTFVSVERLS